MNITEDHLRLILQHVYENMNDFKDWCDAGKDPAKYMSTILAVMTPKEVKDVARSVSKGGEP